MDRPRRKRIRPPDRTADDSTELLQLLGDPDVRVLAFTGAGVSVSAGLAAFTSAGGLYEQARKRYKLKAGKVFSQCLISAKHASPAEC